MQTMLGRRTTVLVAALLAISGTTIAQTGIDTVGTILVVSNDGSDVWNQGGSAVLAVNNQSGTSSLLVNSTRLPGVGGYYCPTFSADGRSICFFGGNSIYTANNDGTGIQKICDSYNSRAGRPTWCSNGYIYWSEFTNEIYRVQVSTKTREKYWTNCPAQGHDATVVEALTVSNDGTRGESNGNGKVNSLDLVNKLLVSQPEGGCAGAISSDGRYQIIQGTAPTTPGSSGGFNGTWLKDFTTGATVSYLNLVTGAQAYYHSGSRNNPSFFVARSLDGPYKGGAIIGNFTRQLSKAVKPASGAWIPSDFWCGPLPGALQTPIIALNTALLTFTSTGTNPATQTVTVTNSGAGTLTAVTTAKQNAWLTVTLSGSGNSQTLTNAVSVSGLADGSYRDTVTVSGGGASNSVKYAVNLTVGTTPAAPSGLTATANPGVMSSSVDLAWVDNSSNETSFIVERQMGTGSWTRRTTTAANATSFRDTGLAAGSYSYRVLARNSSGTSAASNTVTLTVALQPSITLLSPLPSTTLIAGTTIYLSWDARNMTSILLDYSVDGGDTYVHMEGLGAQLEPTDPRWNNYPWVVPAVSAGMLYIKAISYVDRTVFTEQGPYTVQGSAVQSRAAAAGHTLRVAQAPMRTVANAQSFLQQRSGSSLTTVQLNGASVGRIGAGSGRQTMVPAGAAPGVYMVLQR